MDGQEDKFTTRPPPKVSAVGISTTLNPEISWIPGTIAKNSVDID
jgi:hypothetical protein